MNLSERKLIESKGKYFVNDTSEELIFFHFSGFKPGSINFTGRNNDDPEYRFEKLTVCSPKLNFGYAVQKKPMSLKNKIKKAVKKFIK